MWYVKKQPRVVLFIHALKWFNNTVHAFFVLIDL